MPYTHYKISLKNCPDWHEYNVVNLGVSVESPNWQAEKFGSILFWASKRFSRIIINVTDALYRHNFAAMGLDMEKATVCANALGSLWLTRHQSIIDLCPIPVTIYRWGEWYKHPDFLSVCENFKELYKADSLFKEKIHNDMDSFCERLDINLSEKKEEHYLDYLIEELAISTLQARQVSCLKAYPGDDLACFDVIRKRLIPNAPTGLENERFARIKFKRRNSPLLPSTLGGAGDARGVEDGAQTADIIGA